MNICRILQLTLIMNQIWNRNTNGTQNYISDAHDMHNANAP